MELKSIKPRMTNQKEETSKPGINTSVRAPMSARLMVPPKVSAILMLLASGANVLPSQAAASVLMMPRNFPLQSSNATPRNLKRMKSTPRTSLIKLTVSSRTGSRT